MNYLEDLPEDILYISLSYLRYNQIIKSSIKTNFEKLIQLKYPGFYIIVNTIKKEHNVYYDFSWQRAYELIDRLEYLYQTNNKDVDSLNIRSNNPEEIMDIIVMELCLDETTDITAAYSISTDGEKIILIFINI